MSATESPGLQNFIHALEQGRFRFIVQWAVVIAAAVMLALIYLGLITIPPWSSNPFYNFRGFGQADAIDQAQIAREVARGHGFSTGYIRPLAIAHLEKNGRLPATGQLFPDTYQAPLGPAVNSVLLRAMGDKAVKTNYAPGEFVHPAERAIAALSMFFFLAAIFLHYRLARRLFDDRLALAAAGLALVCDLPWQFAIAGLPQNLLLFIFSFALLALARAIEARRAGTPGRAMLWLVAVSALLGVITLGHGIAAWIFLGTLVFGIVYFRPRLLTGLALVVPFLLVLSPWLARNYKVSGNPLGIAGYALYDGLGGSTEHRMRTLNPSVRDTPPSNFRPKLQNGVAAQLQNPLGPLGCGVLAAAFFVGLLYPFRRPETDALRWAVFAMWLALVVGSALLGVPETAVYAGQLHVLLLPIVIAYGLALLLVLFSRLTIGTVPIWRLAFFVALFAITSLPMIGTLLTRTGVVQYPPYFPAAIAKLSTWVKSTEVLGSDMPWAVAWYADRRSVQLPLKVREFTDFGDQSKLPGPLAGVFLSPVSRNASFFTDILRGDYQDWTPLVFGNTGLKDFPFREGLPIGDGSMTFFSDQKRWELGVPQ